MKIDNQKSRNKTLDCYKGLLIVLVVIRHALQNSVADEGGMLTNIIWAIQMPGFMLVSGYFAARRIQRGGIAESILKSVEHYLLPFLTWRILIDVLIEGGFGRNLIVGIITLFTNVDGGLWFLWTIFVLSIIAAICNYLSTVGKTNFKKIIYCIISCILFFGVLVAIVLFTQSTSILGIKYILYYAVFYGLGWLTRKTENMLKPLWDKYGSIVFFVCLAVSAAIVVNYDLYHCEDDIISIALRCIAGFAGNAVILALVNKFKNFFIKLKMDKIGLYTLEIYCTHMRVHHLMTADNAYNFFTVMGFGNFLISLILTVLFTVIIIAVFKSIPIADYLMYGKRNR